MKTILLPNSFRPIGWILFPVSLVMGILILTNVISCSGTTETVIHDVTIIGLALGTLFTTCSKEKQEDELTSAIRLHSLLTSMYIYIAILMVCTICFNGVAYFMFMAVNLGLFPIVFLTVFKLKLASFKYDCNNEK